MERFKTLLQIATLLVALFQLIFSNAQLAEEHIENAAQIVELSKCVEAQNAYIEAAFRGGSNE